MTVVRLADRPAAGRQVELVHKPLDRAVAVVGQRVMLMLKAGLPQAPIKAANSKK